MSGQSASAVDQRVSRAFRPGSRRRRLFTVTVAAITAGLITACGSTQHTRRAVVEAPDARLLDHPSVRVSGALKQEERLIHQHVLAALHQPDHQKYGGIPLALRKSTAPVDQVLTATPSRPAWSIQGEAIQLHLSNGATALASVSGPYVPDRYQGSFKAYTPVTFRFTFAHVTGSVPLKATMFKILTENGTLLRPGVTVPGGGQIPASVPKGKPFTLTFHTIMPNGQGEFSYCPFDGRYLAQWDFTAETD